MTATNLAERFPMAEPLKTVRGAMRRLKAAENLPGVKTEVVEVEGGYLAVALLNSEGRMYAGALAARGICVTDDA